MTWRNLMIVKVNFQCKMSFNPDLSKQSQEVIFSCKSKRSTHPPLFFNTLHGKTIFSFSKSSEKMVFPKKIALDIDLSCIIWKDGAFFTQKYLFSLDGKWKVIFLKKCMEIWYFLHMCINVTNMLLPFCQKNQKRSSPEKMYLKVTETLDWHSRNSSNDSLCFYEDLHRRFHILLSSET